jgi:plasmid stabilization system protein ParE
MTYRVIIQPTAEAELEAAYRRIRDHAPAAAARWFNGMVEAINTLQDFPARCPLAPENGHFAEEIRQLLYGRGRDPYRILFTIGEEAVHVLHIRHGARRYLHEE